MDRDNGWIWPAGQRSHFLAKGAFVTFENLPATQPTQMLLLR